MSNGEQTTGEAGEEQKGESTSQEYTPSRWRQDVEALAQLSAEQHQQDTENPEAGQEQEGGNTSQEYTPSRWRQDVEALARLSAEQHQQDTENPEASTETAISPKKRQTSWTQGLNTSSSFNRDM